MSRKIVQMLRDRNGNMRGEICAFEGPVADRLIASGFCVAVGDDGNPVPATPAAETPVQAPEPPPTIDGQSVFEFDGLPAKVAAVLLEAGLKDATDVDNYVASGKKLTDLGRAITKAVEKDLIDLYCQ